MRISQACTIVLSLFLCVFLVGCGDSPESLAKDKLNALGEGVAAAFGGDKEKAKAAEAKMKTIDEKIAKLSADDKKKFDAALEKLVKEAAEAAKKKT